MSKHKEMRLRLWCTISYKSLYFVHWTQSSIGAFVDRNAGKKNGGVKPLSSDHTQGRDNGVPEVSHLINRDSVFSDLLNMRLLELSSLTGP